MSDAEFDHHGDVSVDQVSLTEELAGAGITSMRDRVAAFGGRLEISSAPRVGTTVRGLVTTDCDAAMTRPD